MRLAITAAVVLLLGTTWAGAGEFTASSGIGGDAPQPSGADCGTLLMNADLTYEIAYNWEYGGIVPPYYGAFAECYDGPGEVCAVVCDLTGSGFQAETCMDTYVWGDDGGVPGEVLAAHFASCLTAPAYPTFQRYVVPIAGAPCIADRIWVGLWYAQPGLNAIWYVGADLDGSGGCPMTNIAPGIGYPTGWQNVSVAFGPVQAMGIGVEVVPCEPTPTMDSSWGQVKRLYQ